MSVYDIHLDGTESVGPDGQYLVWIRRGRLDVEMESSLEQALRTARMYDDSEYALFDCVEGPAGVVPESEVEAWISALDCALAEAQLAAEMRCRGTIRFHVMLRHPNTDAAAEFDWRDTEESARELAAEVNLPGRVQIYSAPYGYTGSPREKHERRVIMDWGGSEWSEA